MSNEKSTLLASDEVGGNSRKSWASVVALGLAVASAAGVGFTVGSGKSTSLYSAQDGAQPHYSGERRGNPGDWDDSNAGSRASRDVNYAVETRAPRTGTHAPRNSKFKSEGNHVGEKHDRTTAEHFDESLRSAGAIHKANPTKASRVIIPRRDRSGTKTPQEETHTETNYWANGPGKHVRTGVKNDKAGQHEVHARTAVPKYHGEGVPKAVTKDVPKYHGEADTNGMRCEITGMKLDIGHFYSNVGFTYWDRRDLTRNVFYTGVTEDGYSCGDDSHCTTKPYDDYMEMMGRSTHRAPRCQKKTEDLEIRRYLGLDRWIPSHGGMFNTVLVTNSTCPYDGKLLMPATGEDGEKYWDVSGGGKINDDYFQTSRENQDAVMRSLWDGRGDVDPDLDLTPPGLIPVRFMRTPVVSSGKLLSFEEGHSCKYSNNPFAKDCAYTRKSRDMAFDVVDDVVDVNTVALLRRPYLTPVTDADGNMWVFEKDHGSVAGNTYKAPTTSNKDTTIEVFPSRAIYDSVDRRSNNYHNGAKSGRTGAFIKMTCSKEDIKTCNEGAKKAPFGGWLDCPCAKTEDIPDDWTFPLIGEIRGEENGPLTTALCVEKGKKPGKDESGCYLKPFSSGGNTAGCLEDDACEIVEEDVTCFSSMSLFDRRLFDPKCAMRQNGLSGEEGACAVAFTRRIERQHYSYSYLDSKGSMCLSVSDVEKEWFPRLLKSTYEQRLNKVKTKFDDYSDEERKSEFEEGYEDSFAAAADAQKAFFTKENIMEMLTRAIRATSDKR